ncbi:entericidin A/B family lipoprotein [Leclercia adecarboxylata]|uniref:Entericidin A/B family lipoprotein n=1 Tax=Leclercia barmai TaxID=2785629 RepID=A0ABS7RY19_9ENTR|nr:MULTISPECIES: entericidin A/B family lipoprotein [Enterobacteriaceae]MBZ0057918.1 entericidin A/B family lipoprotein [Leclercia sp. EMC7]MCM5696314.1 entericidin A/B family lipoprotein [Leclercia sp. LTM01]MCM5700484.1 entericidin A/B family lipoprotein [Leclercia sp. LTM14]QCZ27596.1 entericidin A/B family lipoprotein [Leclercia adecarboxylata]TLU67881.1 entericidin A/B family lipoprotein [Enterobacter sp. MF024]
MQRTIKIVLMMVIASTMLSGCNTARGVGEDIKSLGNAISHAAS